MRAIEFLDQFLLAQISIARTVTEAQPSAIYSISSCDNIRVLVTDFIFVKIISSALQHFCNKV